MAAIDAFLRHMVDAGASDLHLASGFHPYLRLSGSMIEQKSWPVLPAAQITMLIREIAPAANFRQFEAEKDSDFAYEIPGVSRFRANIFQDRYGPGLVLRTIPTDIPSVEELGIPAAVRSFSLLSKGLVLVTGPTGSGKSTTLAALIDGINRTRDEHIITIEDPIEFVHRPVRCLINQREVHRDTESFARALRAALREDPDIVLVGEMRDLETIEIALETAETGHLVFGTVHTNSAATTVDRIIDKFPADRQNQIRVLLGDTLQGVVAQTLCKKIDGGRVAAFEILISNVAVAAHIREGKTFLIPSVMQTSKSLGMQTFSDDLVRLAIQGKITPEEAYLKAVNKEEMRVAMENAGIPLDFLSFEDKSGRREKAIRAMIESLKAALKKSPNDVSALNDLAWIYATSPVRSLRDGHEAVRLAEKMKRISRSEDVSVLDTLATAYASDGEFKQAVAYMEKAVAIAREKDIRGMIAPVSARLAIFRKGRPFCDDSIGL